MGKAIETGARTLLACLLCVGAASALSACKAAQQSKEHELDLAQITRWLPGNYNNNAQHEADVRAGKKSPHEALAISIVPIDSPQFGRVYNACIGAMMVGSIKLTVKPGDHVTRTQEFGSVTGSYLQTCAHR